MNKSCGSWRHYITCQHESRPQHWVTKDGCEGMDCELCFYRVTLNWPDLVHVGYGCKPPHGINTDVLSPVFINYVKRQIEHRWSERALSEAVDELEAE